jgi:hypothetical protein
MRRDVARDLLGAACMRRLSILLFTLTSSALVTGCDLYFSGGGDDDVCPQYERGDFAPAYELRNPQTGQCESQGGGGCDACSDCVGVPTAQPDWGQCYSSCEGLSEASCVVTRGCFAAYTDFSPLERAPAFRGCWQTAPSGPISSGSCVDLDAYACSRHDNCSASYSDNGGRSSFVQCHAERNSCQLDTDCARGNRCSDGQCVPTSCANVDCGPGSHCEDQCYPCDAANGTSCEPQCQPMCVPDGNACELLDCAPDYTCVEICSDPSMGGTGACRAECVPSARCEALPSEAACGQRADCVSVYRGDDCTCYPDHCECNVLTYDRCETR